MALPVFPDRTALPGISWPVIRRPVFATRIVTHASGREARAAYYARPVWEYDLTFEGLASGAAFPGLGAQTYQLLLGFYATVQSVAGTFLFNDVDDNTATAQSLGAGNGAQTSFALQRTLGGFTEPVKQGLTVSAVFLNGVNQATGWTFTAPGPIVFATAPGAGVAVTATFTFAWECRFVDDSIDFEKTMYGLFAAKTVKFRTVK